ncbi:hypothetical protein, partial [Thalassobacterium sedimentorum]|uniref:hypothetical protein n=1 Tax=Thalassobacterium sedimentorum TaxID=3041258 RepID=UPI0028115F51
MFLYCKLFPFDGDPVVSGSEQGAALCALEMCLILFSTILVTATGYYRIFDMKKEIERTKQLLDWRMHLLHLVTFGI